MAQTASAIAFINNKGGVGKTTLLCNLASLLSIDGAKRVLVIDLDPQCNATQLLLSGSQWDAIFTREQSAVRETVWKSLSYLRRGDSAVDPDVQIHRSDRFGVDVLAGHPSMSLIEDTLSSSWQDMSRGDLGGLRRSLWLRDLVSTVRRRYDFILVDAGPSLGALNRSVLLGVEGFVTPTAADLFSVYALDNIRTWMNSWRRTFENGLTLTRENLGDELQQLWDRPLDSLEFGAYVGFTIQQYVTRAMQGGERRGTNAYDHYRKQIPTKAFQLGAGSIFSSDRLNLGTVPYMFAMVPLAQAAHAPIGTLTGEDGIKGAQYSQQLKYRTQLTTIASHLSQAFERLGAPSW